ncbi:MAG: glutamate-cysteine ligase family protein, partial [Cyanobacteria bacterium P01_A01_bin.135]
TIRDATKIYWDLRLSEHVPTVEFRFADVCMTVDEAIMVTGLVRALARTCYQEITAGQASVGVRPEVLQAARWQAARHGLSGNLIDVVGQTAKPAPQVVAQLLDYVGPALQALGDADEVLGLVQRTLNQGSGAQRQRQVYGQSQRFEDVVDYLVAQTAEGVS